MMRSIGWPLVIIASALGAGLMMFSNTVSPLRPVLIFWFLLICPGMAFLRLLRLQERLTELTLAIALSLALDTIVAEAMISARLWSPQAGLVTLIGLSIGGAVLQIIQALEVARQNFRRQRRRA